MTRLLFRHSCVCGGDIRLGVAFFRHVLLLMLIHKGLGGILWKNFGLRRYWMSLIWIVLSFFIGSVDHFAHEALESSSSFDR